MADRPATTSRNPYRPGRNRRLAGWLLLAIGVLITGVWGASKWWSFGYQGTHWQFSASGGCCTATFQAIPTSISPWGWHFEVLDRGGYPAWEWRLPPDYFRSRYGLIWRNSVDLSAIAYGEFNWTSSGGQWTKCVLTFPWPFALAALLAGAVLLLSARRARRRALTGTCLKCGYNLAGLAPNTPCPECGTTRPDPSLRSRRKSLAPGASPG